jgi:hypothetical protein
MRPSTVIASIATFFFANMAIANPLALRPVQDSVGCVCVTDPCPCIGLKAREVPEITEEWCRENKDDCRVALGFGKAKREAKPMMDPLEACLANWKLCTSKK